MNTVAHKPRMKRWIQKVVVTAVTTAGVIMTMQLSLYVMTRYAQLRDGGDFAVIYGHPPLFGLREGQVWAPGFEITFWTDALAAGIAAWAAFAIVILVDELFSKRPSSGGMHAVLAFLTAVDVIGIFCLYFQLQS